MTRRIRAVGDHELGLVGPGQTLGVDQLAALEQLGVQRVLELDVRLDVRRCPTRSSVRSLRLDLSVVLQQHESHVLILSCAGPLWPHSPQGRSRFRDLDIARAAVRNGVVAHAGTADAMTFAPAPSQTSRGQQPFKEARVRKVVLYTLMSLDGAVDHPGRYFAPGQEPGEVPEFDPVMVDNEERIIGTQDAVLLGRHMYDEWSQFWPTADHEPFARFINNVKKYVVTSTPLSRPWHNAEAVDGPIEDLVRDLKARPGGDIGVHGSIQLAQSMLEAGLVDELQLVVGPVARMRGAPAVRGTPTTARPARACSAPYPRPAPACCSPTACSESGRSHQRPVIG